jgi:hypothetical protein
MFSWQFGDHLAAMQGAAKPGHAVSPGFGNRPATSWQLCHYQQAISRPRRLE